MEGIDKDAGRGVMVFNAEEEEEAKRSVVFEKLKPYCLHLLQILQNPNSSGKHSSMLSQLLQFLRTSPSSALQPYFDYTLFPLLLLLDAAVECRSQQKKVGFEDKFEPNPALKVNDSVAEGVIQCLEELLEKCYIISVNQMVIILKKLTYGALLSPSKASEEIREGVIRCFRALLLSLCPCSDESCPCRRVIGFPALLGGSDLPSQTRSKYDSEPEECLLAFLQSQTASAAVGHWLSLLLKAGDLEAARGHRGSAKLRVEAFLTLRILVSKVGVADALAFFLPGVVSQFGKVLHVSKTMISGAAGSVEAIDQAIRGLAEYLMIVLQDEANESGLNTSRNVISDINLIMDKPSESILEELRHLPINVCDRTKISAEGSNGELVEKKVTDSANMIKSLQVSRTKDWIEKTSAHVDKLLSMTFPHICVHPAKRVRQGLLAAIKGLLSECTYTLKESRFMLLECLCVLVCDDFEEVSSAAQKFLELLFSSGDVHYMDTDVADMFTRLIEKLPKLVLGTDEALALSHARQLLVLIFYSGPRHVVDHLFQSPVIAARFLDVFALCLSQNSAFAGPLDKLILARPSSSGYLPSISELRAGIQFAHESQTIMKTTPLEAPKLPRIEGEEIQCPWDNVQKDYGLPRMPPWFLHVGSQKLYEALAGILRLVGLSFMADFRSEGCLSIVTDIPLGHVRKLVSEVRKKEYSRESWQSWYYRTGSGQLLRQASTAACMLNEMIYGVSNQAGEKFRMMFRSKREKEEKPRAARCVNDQPCELEPSVRGESLWKVCEGGAKSHLIDCIGNILHEYLSPEVWNLPIEHKSSLEQSDDETGEIPLHFCHDTTMLHQIIIDGIGIYNICLGKDFASSGFLHSSLYLLLENLISSNFQIRSASDAVLHVLAATSGYLTVGHLVVANSDYVIDSICRQLRHLDLNPHVPNVLAAMLSYVGVAHKILPLLEEPMRAVSLELEILGRHQHPDLTIPFLKAVSEITKASRREACLLPSQAESYKTQVKSVISDMVKKARPDYRSHDDDDIDMTLIESDVGAYINEDSMQVEHWENILLKLNDSKRYRRTVGSIATSCLTAATPLLASAKQATCLVALDVIEDGVATLAKVEEAYKIEKETKEVIEQMIQLCSYYDLQDTLDAADEGNDENRLLPAVNKIWPFLVVCVQNKNPVVVRRCLDVVSSVVQTCGGDFFSRRFHNDGPHFWKILKSSPFQKKPISKEDRAPLQLPYRSSPYYTEDSMAEVSNLKVQAAVLNMIANLSRNKRSASALECVFKKVSAVVVGIASSGVTGLRDASLNAVVGLASIDPDLIWLLLADVYYSLKKRDLPSPPIPELPEMVQILPPPLSPKDYLYVQYGGQSYGFDIDFASVDIVFKLLHSQVFTSQM